MGPAFSAKYRPGVLLLLGCVVAAVVAGVRAAVLAGVLSTLAGQPGHGWLAWIALVPLFLALPLVSRATTVGVGIVYATVLGVGSVLPWLGPAAALGLGGDA